MTSVQLCTFHQIRLCRRCENADAEGLCQNQNVSRLCTGIGQYPLRMHKARDRQTVDRLRAVDGVPAGDDCACFIRLVVAAAQNLAHSFIVHRVRQAHDVERQLRRAAHGVDVAERVRRGNLPVQERVVHNRREKVRRLDDCRVVTDDIDACVVALVVADDQPRVCVRAEALQHFDERSRADLCPAARAGGKLCQFYIRFHAQASSLA